MDARPATPLQTRSEFGTLDCKRFVEVRNPHTGKLLFKYDPQRELIEIRERGEVTLVDLTQYRPPAA